MFGSDCSDSVGAGPACSGSQCIAAVWRLAPSSDILQDVLYRNAIRILEMKT
jgi:hypothetical protein